MFMFLRTHIANVSNIERDVCFAFKFQPTMYNIIPTRPTYFDIFDIYKIHKCQQIYLKE